MIEIAERLAGLRPVPSGVLADIVTQDGACMEVSRVDGPPRWLHEEGTDRELAARLCQGCPVQRQCLELELRMFGVQTVRVWGALGEDDRRALVPLWRATRSRSVSGGAHRRRPVEPAGPDDEGVAR